MNLLPVILVISHILLFLLGFFIGIRYHRQEPPPTPRKKIKVKNRIKAGILKDPTPQQLKETKEEKEYDKIVSDRIKKLIKGVGNGKLY